MPWSTDDIKRLIEIEARLQGVDPQLALAVATQESYLNPNATGDGGRSRGLFQLQEAAATDAGIDPARRHEVPLNVEGGVRYLKLKLDQSGGNVEQALSRYNRGTPDYRGIGDPNYVQNVLRFYPGREPQQQPGMGQRVTNFLSPASAEAAEPTYTTFLQKASTPPPPTTNLAGRTRLEEIEAELARRDAQQPATPQPRPSPPTATSTPAEDAAYRQWAVQQGAGATTTPAPVSQAPPAQSRLTEVEAELARRDALQAPGTPAPAPPPVTPAEEPLTPEARFLSLSSIQQMPLEARIQAFKDFYGLRPEFKEEFLRSEEPPSDLTIDIEKPSTPAPPRTPEERQTRVREELAAWEKQAGRPWRQGDPRMPSEARLGVPDEAPLEEGFTRPSTMIPLLMGGAGVKTVTRTLGEVPAVVSRIARPVVEGLSQTLGWGTGRTIETGQVPSPGELGQEAALATVAGGALETLSAGTRAVLRRTRAGKAITAADDATQAARQQWEQEAAAARQAQQQGQRDLYERALEKATQAQREYQAARLRRDDLIAANQQEYDWAVRSQGEAIQQARQVPGRYQPETPSWVLYEKFGDAAKDAVVDLAPARTALAEVRASRGVLPDGTARPFPQAVESIAANLEKASGTANVQTIRNELRRLGPLTRSPNGDIRGPAKQLYGIYADALEASPVANDLLRQANATFRKEMALQDVQEWLRPGHGVVRIDSQGRQTINVGALMTRLEKHIGDDTFFARSFAPEELQALRHDLGRLAGTPNMPRTAPRLPREVAPPDLEFLPGGAGAMRRPPEIPAEPGATRPTVERPRIFPRGQEWAQQAGKWGGLLYVLDQIGVSPKTVAALKVGTVAQQQASWLLAKLLLTPRLRPLLEAGMEGNGRIHPGTYKAVMAALSASERRQMERETKPR